MKFFYDTEFIEDGRTIDLVSIGIVAEDGRQYYAVNRTCHWERVGHPQFQWIRENVWKHLPTDGPGQLCFSRYGKNVKDKWQIANEVKDFLLYGWTFPTPEYQDPAKMSKPELWADYPAYDHVALCQLWGRMIDLPQGIPMRTNDLVQFADVVGCPESDLPKQDPATQHHALHDALHNQKVYKFLEDRIYPQRWMILNPDGAGYDPTCTDLTHDHSTSGCLGPAKDSANG